MVTLEKKQMVLTTCMVVLAIENGMKMATASLSLLKVTDSPSFYSWRATHGDDDDLESCSQNGWYELFLKTSVEKVDNLNSLALDNVRVLAVKSELWSTWLRTVPYTSCGRRFDDSVIRVSLGLRLDRNFGLDSHIISPWAMGRSLAWDVTFPHTMAKRYISFTSVEAGTAALKVYDQKFSISMLLSMILKFFNQYASISLDQPTTLPICF
ncbi:hypothetical protein HELRODRAFT_164125 [Helobdella robusta]|uniref:Uncharacterized protein n=1 Tax=Helobdella robusta TaxID=6412 RepID=T1EUY9_HELRO|nr:hypothetical protein HELRODRAFT_164125 [Helobdella robusta]ESN94308.1 hypothetical protein HELRODRAFT_164125 [Helobdella robusta]